MRKKIFIIHGKGPYKGIGREAGGDLDTISSNVFLSLWAKNFIKKEYNREAILGVDYDFDFLNYSEGLKKLSIHNGCDIYLPDFPIDALAPRLSLLLLDDPSTVDLFISFTEEMQDFKKFMISNADKFPEEIKTLFNFFYKQTDKILEYQNPVILYISINILFIIKSFFNLYITFSENNLFADENFFSLFEKIYSSLFFDIFQNFKKEILKNINTKVKEQQIDIIEDKDQILEIDASASKDLAAFGRCSYSDELIVITTAICDYFLRGKILFKKIDFEDNIKTILKKSYADCQDILIKFYQELKNDFISLTPLSLESDRSIINNCIGYIDNIINFINKLDEYAYIKQEKDIYDINAFIIEQENKSPVKDVEIILTKIRGNGFFLIDNKKTDDIQITVKSNEKGLVSIQYQKRDSEDEFFFSITYDELNYIYFPQEKITSEDLLKSLIEEAETDLIQANSNDKSSQIGVRLIKGHIDELIRNNIFIKSIDDHHPYTKEIFNFLKEYEKQGLIGEVSISSKERGVEIPIENQRCGADMVYEKFLRNTECDNESVQFLKHLAHCQDLHIEAIDLAIELSKLIGSKYNKKQMVINLANNLDSIEKIKNIMSITKWDVKVREYEEGLRKVLPRVKNFLCEMIFIKNDLNLDNYKKNFNLKENILYFFSKNKTNFLKNFIIEKNLNTIKILTTVSPFCDPKKNEVQINVASFINYMQENNIKKDYVFYCYGSQLMTTRKPNPEEKTFDLSVLAQKIGSKSDGGHSGAATCRPSANPLFPFKKFSKIKETNFIEFLYYLSSIIEEHYPVKLLDIRPIDFTEPDDIINNVLEKIDYQLYKIILDNKAKTDILIVKAPAVDYASQESKPSFLQVLNYLKKKYKNNYIFFIQGGMYSMVLINNNDTENILNLNSLASQIGWSEDSGLAGYAIADIKKNKKISKKLKWLGEQEMLCLCYTIGDILESQSGIKIKAILPEFQKSLSREFDEKVVKYINRAMDFEFDIKNKNIKVSLKALIMTPPKNKKQVNFLSIPVILSSMDAVNKEYTVLASFKNILIFNNEDRLNKLDLSRVYKVLTEKENPFSKKCILVNLHEIKNLPGKLKRINNSNLKGFLSFIKQKIEINY